MRRPVDPADPAGRNGEGEKNATFRKSPFLLRKNPDFGRFSGVPNRPKSTRLARKAARGGRKNGRNRKSGVTHHPSGAQSALNKRSRTLDRAHGAKSAWYSDGASGPLKTVPKTGQNSPKSGFLARFGACRASRLPKQVKKSETRQKIKNPKRSRSQEVL